MTSRHDLTLETRRGRTRWTAGVSAVLVVVAFVIAQPSAAQVSAPAPGEPVRNGTAKATAIVQRVAPGVGQVELGIATGKSVTQVTNSLGQATSQAVDLGLLGTALTLEMCGSAPPLSESDIPQPTSVDNRDGDASVRRDEAGLPGSPGGVGHMAVDALADAPEAMAVTTLSNVALAPGIGLGGGTATAISRVLPGKGREAVASVDVSLNLGPLLQLSGMRWEATHRTGTDRLVEGSFDIGRAEIGALPVPADDLDALEQAVNQALAAIGITISFPRVEQLTDPVDVIRVTPMRIEFGESPVGTILGGPLLDLTREQRGQLFDTLVSIYCQASTALLVGDVGISIATGTGYLVVEVGGVEATSGDFVAESPFGAPIVPPTPTQPDAPIVDTDPSAIDAPATERTTVATSVPVDDIALPAASSGPLQQICESIHPRRSPDCSFGSAGAVAALGFFATVSVAGADVLQRRRRAQVERTEFPAAGGRTS